MAPIKIAFIGLTAKPGYVWSKLAHLPYLQQSSKYEIVGVCNSSKERSEAAIKAFDLPATTKAYGSTDELAADSDAYDFAVCSVRVDKHLPTIQAVAAKGKPCYVEWPLGRNLAEAQALQAAVQSAGGARTIVGLQARAAPLVRKVKSLLAGGAVGRVLSSSIQASAGNLGAVDPEGVAALLNDAGIGGTMLSIHFAHLLDYVLHIHSEPLASLSAVVATQIPNPRVRAADGSLRETTRDAPDEVALQGKLGGGAVLSIHLRGGAPFKGEPGLRWRIYGDKGEIEVTADGAFLQIGYPHMAVRLHDHESDEVTNIDFAAGVDDGLDALPLQAVNIGRIYEAFADGNKELYADWDDAVAHHRILEKMMESSTNGTVVQL